MAEVDRIPAGVDLSKPSPARMYDYILGGAHNFAVDREATEVLRAAVPELEDGAWANRGFHGRAARWMAAEHGIRQFLDLGSGLPTQRNTHEALREVVPDARVVYVDIDPMVAILGQDLLDDDGTTAVIEADLRDPDDVLSRPELRKLIDFAEPAGLLVTNVMDFIPDSEDPWGIVARYLDALVPGSFLALSHYSADKIPHEQVRATTEVYERSTENVYPRAKAEIARFFDGLELVCPYEGAPPGLTNAGLWGAVDPKVADSDGSRAFFCGVARKR